MSNLPVDRDHSAKHGQRVAFPPSAKGDSIPVLEFIDRLDAQLVPHARLLIDSRDAGADARLIVSQVNLTKVGDLIGRNVLVASDVDLLTKIGDGAGHMSERQVIAVGRHENAFGTARSIRWELRNWWDWFCAATSSLNERALWQALSFARECIQKSSILNAGDELISDRAAYAAGARVLRSGLISADVRDLFDNTHSDTDDIWDDPSVGELGFPCYCAWTLSVLLSGTAFQSPAFERTRFARRIEIKPASIVSAREDLARCLGVVESDAPARFSEKWLSRQEPDTGLLIERLRSTSTATTADLKGLAESCRMAGDILYERHIGRVIARRD